MRTMFRVTHVKFDSIQDLNFAWIVLAVESKEMVLPLFSCDTFACEGIHIVVNVRQENLLSS